MPSRESQSDSPSEALHEKRSSDEFRFRTGSMDDHGAVFSKPQCCIHEISISGTDKAQTRRALKLNLHKVMTKHIPLFRSLSTFPVRLLDNLRVHTAKEQFNDGERSRRELLVACSGVKSQQYMRNWCAASGLTVAERVLRGGDPQV